MQDENVDASKKYAITITILLLLKKCGFVVNPEKFVLPKPRSSEFNRLQIKKATV